MASRVLYKASVERDMKRLDRAVSARILGKIDRELSKKSITGVPLTGEFQGLFKYRVGDYRVIYAKIPEGILIVRINHRKEAYRS